MRTWGKVALIAFCAALPLLMAPTGGFPSRPRFQAVGINTAVPSVGNLSVSGSINTANVNATGIVDTVGLNATDASIENVEAVSTLTLGGAAVATRAPDAATSTEVGQLVSVQFKGGNTDRANTATLAADVTLAGLDIPAAGTYLIDSQLCFVGPVSGAGGIKFRYEFSGTVTGGTGLYTGNVNAAVVASGGFLALDANQISFATITTATASDCLRFSHTAVVTGAGTMDLQWAQNASNANATRLSAGSAVWIIRIG